jgi:nucleotide-binding universal stress UspA family protein|mmetsp:Transcript_105157/g.165947  ORF Transcript_105157/g.165947 Transcript_105157/m.165947 type:complete len:345 (+) Transcript_105157:78-1112(+)
MVDLIKDDALDNAPPYKGWIEVPVCELILSEPLTFLCAIDGSDYSLTGLQFLLNVIMPKRRDSKIEVLHVYDMSKDFLPPQWRQDQLKATVDAHLTSSIPQSRFKRKWEEKGRDPVSHHMFARIAEIRAEFACMGWYGRKGRKARPDLLASNVSELISRANCGVIIMKDDSKNLLPIGRPAKYVVSVSLNQASTKAFLDVLRLSNPGDEIKVVYVKCFMESTDSDYTAEVRAKYSGFFEGLKDEQAPKFNKFHDRNTEFVLVQKTSIHEATSEAIVRYAEEIEADFIAVGTNMLRGARGKTPIGSVSLDVLLLWERNCIVSHWIDVSPRVYEESVRPGSQGRVK